jgi:shikimate kinase
MKILRKETFVIYLHASYETIARRIERRSKRSSNGGIVFGKHKNLKGLYRFRTRLYGKSAHMKFSTDGHRSVAAHRLAKKLQRSGIA